MGIQQLDLLIRDECTRDQSCDQGFCVCNTSEGNVNFMLIRPPPPRVTFVNHSLRKFLLAGFRKLLYICARVLCFDKVFLCGLLLLHWELPMLVAACSVRQQGL